MAVSLLLRSHNKVQLYLVAAYICEIPIRALFVEINEIQTGKTLFHQNTIWTDHIQRHDDVTDAYPQTDKTIA